MKKGEKKKKEAKATKATNSNSFDATMKVLGKTYRGTGSTVSEAISNIKDFGNVKGKIILTLEHNGQTKERVLMPTIGFRLFSASRMIKEIALKQVSSLFF